MIVVTGGAGYIGSNFVLEWLGQHDESVVNIDLLTYAGSLDNLTTLENDPSHIFVRGDIGEANLISSLLQHYQPVPSLTSRPRV